jgi:hypothetical protein
MKLYDFMHDPELCAATFAGQSWDTWRVVARLWDGDAALLTLEEQKVASQLIGGQPLPSSAPQELVIGAGRRSGKTRFDALLGVHAASTDYRDRLAPGEWATVSCHCVDKRQARTWFAYCQGLIDASAMLTAEVRNITAEAIEFNHRTRLEVHTASFRSIRGYSLALAIIDEAAYLRDLNSALPDLELYRALRPALATLQGRLVVTSSLHRKTGLMWKKHREFYGAAA